MTKAWVKLPPVRTPAAARVGPGPDAAQLPRLSSLGGSLALLLANGGDRR